ncbi:MAG: hypothetical protein OXC40_04490 [Proteobacteria bacterium]|nr:hypothetical protein [Pseudomonadota bacterium]
MLSTSNFLTSCLSFEDRQAGVSIIYCHQSDKYVYHGYCLETKLSRDLMSVEFDVLEDAISYINEEFLGWQLQLFNDDGGCGSCHAK